MIKTTVNKFFNWYFGEDAKNVLDFYTENIIDIFGNIISYDQEAQFDPGTGDFNTIVTIMVNTLKKHKNEEINVETGTISGAYFAKFTINDANYGDIEFDLDCMNEFIG